MDTVIYDGWLVLTPWKIIGYFGVLCFGLRWVVQIIASHKEKRVTVPMVFWSLTLLGASLQLIYWTLGPKNDSVGVLQSATPFAIAAYNLALEAKGRRKSTEAEVPVDARSDGASK